MIVSEDSNAGAVLDAIDGQPLSNTFRHPPDFCVGIALHLIAFLNFKAGVVGPAFGTFAEAIEESGHGSARILHDEECLVGQDHAGRHAEPASAYSKSPRTPTAPAASNVLGF